MRCLSTCLAAMAALAFLGSTAHARDSQETLNHPAASLVAPFTNTADDVSFFIVTNLGGVSPGPSGVFSPNSDIPKITTHWSYWSEDCAHLGDVNICLTLNDTIVVDTRIVQSVNGDNQTIGPKLILDDQRGFVIVTAYETDEECRDATHRGEVVVDDALVGSYTFANTPTGSSAGNVMPGFGAVNGIVNLPDACYERISLATFRESSLDFSQLVGFTLEERQGEDTGYFGELGPINGRVVGSGTFYDNVETRTSLQDIEFRCGTFINTLARNRGGVFPLEGASGGFFSFENLRVLRDNGDVEPLGGTTAIVAALNQAVGTYGASTTAAVQEGTCEMEPTPTPPPAPTPTPAPTAPPFEPTPTPPPAPTPTPGATPTPGCDLILDPGCLN
jgi:hypothetical protein